MEATVFSNVGIMKIVPFHATTQASQDFVAPTIADSSTDGFVQLIACNRTLFRGLNSVFAASVARQQMLGWPTRFGNLSDTVSRTFRPVSALVTKDGFLSALIVLRLCRHQSNQQDLRLLFSRCCTCAQRRSLQGFTVLQEPISIANHIIPRTRNRLRMKTSFDRRHTERGETWDECRHSPGFKKRVRTNRCT
jgi:hypothetical protein